MSEHTFDWHQEPHTSLLHHALLWMVTADGRAPHEVDEIVDATDSWKSVKLGITLNGHEIDAEAFIKELDRAFDSAVRFGVQDTLTEKIPGMDALVETVRQLEEVVKERAIQIAADAGFDIGEDDRW